MQSLHHNPHYFRVVANHADHIAVHQDIPNASGIFTSLCALTSHETMLKYDDSSKWFVMKLLFLVTRGNRFLHLGAISARTRVSGK